MNKHLPFLYTKYWKKRSSLAFAGSITLLPVVAVMVAPVAASNCPVAVLGTSSTSTELTPAVLVTMVLEPLKKPVFEILIYPKYFEVCMPAKRKIPLISVCTVFVPLVTVASFTGEPF